MAHTLDRESGFSAASLLQVYSPSRVLGLLSDLQREVHLLLLFLKSVEGVEVMQWNQGCPQVGW